MTTAHRSGELTDDVVAFYGTPGASLDAFIAAHDGHWRRMANSLYSRHHLSDHDLLDDAYQSVIEEVWRLLDKPPPDLIVDQFGRLVLFRSNTRFIKVLRKTPMLSGVGDLIARRAAFDRTRRAMLFELGYEPSQAEAIEEHNATSRSKVSADDLARSVDVVWTDAIAASHEMSSEDVFDVLSAVRPSDTDLIDIGDVLASTIAMCDDGDRDIIEAHVACSLRDGIPPTRKAISIECGLSSTEVTHALERFRESLVAALDAA